ncbi:MAG: hypothetical protein MK008_00690 [Bdellovibrionales bacterium]|nr:hypothetical protein [Bdellovibrionales bacterium]
MKKLIAVFCFSPALLWAQTSIKECKNDCCRRSIEKAKKNNYPIKTSDFCPNGTIEKYLNCDGSVTWCEPLFKKPSAKE